jgi:hypothetical protein
MSGRTFLLQDWTTIRAASGMIVTQDPSSWLDLDGFADVTCWIDVEEVSTPNPFGTTAVVLQLQTSPTSDDAYFQPLGPPQSFGNGSPFQVASPAPYIVRSAFATSTNALLSSNNLMRYLRWQLAPNGGGSYDLTFRIRAVANRSPVFVPPLIAGCVFWVRADLGIGLYNNTSSVLAWNDQSGSGDANKNLSSTSSTYPTITLADANYNNRPTVSFASSAYMTSPVWVTTLAQPDTWIIVGNPSTTGTAQVAIESNDKTSGQDVQRNASDTISINTTGLPLVCMPAVQWTTPGVVLAEFQGTKSKIFFNNFSSPSAFGAVGVGPNTGQGSLTLGSSDIQWNPTGANFWDGAIAEVIAYNSVLPATSKAQLRNYLTGRYGIFIG